MLHGWPGSVVEFMDLINEPAMAGFHLVIPSLPGYGWSEAPAQPGVDAVAMAQMFIALMSRLGYKEYFVQVSRTLHLRVHSRSLRCAVHCPRDNHAQPLLVATGR